MPAGGRAGASMALGAQQDTGSAAMAPGRQRGQDKAGGQGGCKVLEHVTMAGPQPLANPVGSFVNFPAPAHSTALPAASHYGMDMTQQLAWGGFVAGTNGPPLLMKLPQSGILPVRPHSLPPPPPPPPLEVKKKPRGRPRKKEVEQEGEDAGWSARARRKTAKKKELLQKAQLVRVGVGTGEEDIAAAYRKQSMQAQLQLRHQMLLRQRVQQQLLERQQQMRRMQMPSESTGDRIQPRHGHQVAGHVQSLEPQDIGEGCASDVQSVLVQPPPATPQSPKKTQKSNVPAKEKKLKFRYHEYYPRGQLPQNGKASTQQKSAVLQAQQQHPPQQSHGGPPLQQSGAASGPPASAGPGRRSLGSHSGPQPLGQAFHLPSAKPHTRFETDTCSLPMYGQGAGPSLDVAFMDCTHMPARPATAPNMLESCAHESGQAALCGTAPPTAATGSSTGTRAGISQAVGVDAGQYCSMLVQQQHYIQMQIQLLQHQQRQMASAIQLMRKSTEAAGAGMGCSQGPPPASLDLLLQSQPSTCFGLPPGQQAVCPPVADGPMLPPLQGVGEPGAQQKQPPDVDEDDGWIVTDVTDGYDSLLLGVNIVPDSMVFGCDSEKPKSETQEYDDGPVEKSGPKVGTMWPSDMLGTCSSAAVKTEATAATVEPGQAMDESCDVSPLLGFDITGPLGHNEVALPSPTASAW